ncbi:MAG: 16S rRNA processing protein RimM [Clostridia bacterium]|nr:16S rRNA processing protein RimM [Clostridia bacterium]
MQETLKIGLIVKPQGIRGEVKVQPLTDDINRFKTLKDVIIDGKNYRVLSSVIGGGAVFLALSGISDRNVAETFRGKFLCVTRENAIPLEEGRYFIVDIVGCKVVTDSGDAVGEVVDVFSARTDIFTIKCDNGRIMRFPFLKDLVLKVDIENKLITVWEKRLLEVSCYED